MYKCSINQLISQSIHQSMNPSDPIPSWTPSLARCQHAVTGVNMQRAIVNVLLLLLLVLVVLLLLRHSLLLAQCAHGAHHTSCKVVKRRGMVRHRQRS
jgi:hypothetical protein